MEDSKISSNDLHEMQRMLTDLEAGGNHCAIG